MGREGVAIRAEAEAVQWKKRCWIPETAKEETAGFRD